MATDLGNSWAKSANLVSNYGPIFLIAKFLFMKQTGMNDDFTDPTLAINTEKRKHWKIQRAQLIKQIIVEC